MNQSEITEATAKGTQITQSQYQWFDNTDYQSEDYFRSP